ncbi:Breast cancer anti-estrogen resistance like protein [Argiope bruennichi]|uniref:Breast cancer anti-estrogen resistance like protein n=1 Tax=Argiope bruennichi TaxID=94029 RepID=A0A8T0F0J2_ARGBR|nr:Breast cancer anti-estrogen resistance like protein [Argiope bruennichi]
MANQQPHLSIDLWLDKLDMNVYKPIFKQYNGVENILWMTERDLKNLGIKNGSHRARLGSSLAILKEKYDRASKENRNMLSPNNQSPHSEKAKSIASVSPMRQIHFEESGVRSWPSTRPSTSHSTKHSSPRSSIENFVGTEATAEELKRALEKELNLDSSDLRSYAWYHGTILRQRAEELVVQDGDFLVRDCISQPGDYVITCKWKNVPLHFIIKKVILNPDTVYERFQYCFEKESFDSISDFITYYVGSKCPLSEASGVIISHPVNRVMPLSYYASRYGIQCQIHYVAKALENIPSSPDHQNNNSIPKVSLVEISPANISRSNYLQQSEEDKLTVSNNQSSETNKMKHALHQNSNLIRMGSDPMLSPNTERRSLERRPNSGLFSSETLSAVVMTTEDKPPPKPNERMKILNRWIEIAIETKTTLGNYYGFTSIMLGLTLPEILGLQSTWLALRHSHTEIAFMFETKLRPTLKALQNGSGLEAPNTCLPYILSLILILQKHISVMSSVEKDVDSVCNDIVNFALPGNNSAGDFGLQLLADHLENGRNILQQVPVFKKEWRNVITIYKISRCDFRCF